MRFIVKTAVSVVITVLLVPSLVVADDYIEDAVKALQNAPVHVAPGTERTDNTTASVLQSRLNSDDRIVLVMLPAAAGEEIGADTFTIATRLSEELGNQKIIGLAVGDDVVAYAPILPSGVAADQMKRAISVSNDPITALVTFTQNMHSWQSSNQLPTPEPTATVPPPPQETTEEGSSSWPVWLVVLLGLSGSLLVVSFVATISIAATKPSKEKTSFKAPSQVRDLLAKIAKDREKIHDRSFRETLYQMCLDIENYFQNATSKAMEEAIFFRSRLKEVDEVIAKYINVQDNNRYYSDPASALERGKTSITSFAQYVLDSIQRGRDAELTGFRVNTDILKAQRYR